MPLQAGMSPAHKEMLAKRRNQKMAEDSVQSNGTHEQDDADEQDSQQSQLLTVDEVQIQRDDEGSVCPIRVPYVADMSGTQEPDKHVVIKPWNAQEGREYQIRAYELTQKFENDELENEGGYLKEDGELVAYYMGGGQDGDPWCIPTDLLLTYLNDHLVEPDLPHYSTFSEAEQDLKESMMVGLYITIRVYGPGVSPASDDEDIEVLTDKKK